jgi:hypothetical protein
MKNKKKVYIAVLFLLYLSFARSNYQRTLGSLVFSANERDSLIINFFIDEVIQAEITFEHFFGGLLKNPVQIILAESETEYKDLTGSKIPAWSAGVAFNLKGKIILKPGNYFNPEQYREALLHELVHLYIAEYIGINKLPLWINEGLAMYLSNKSISWQESIFIGNSITSGNILQLTEIDSILIFGFTKARLAYLEAFLAIKYIIKEHNEQILINLIHDFGNSKSIDQIFFRNLGYDFYEFENEFYKEIKRNYRWMVFLQFENLLWFFLVLIIIVAFFVKKLHNRKIYRDWNNEDAP